MKFRVVEDLDISRENPERFFAQVYRDHSEGWHYIQKHQFGIGSIFLTPSRINKSHAVEQEYAEKIIELYKKSLKKDEPASNFRVVKEYD